MMLHIPSVLSLDEVNYLRQRLQETDWVDGKQTVGAQGALVKQNRQLPEHAAISLELGQMVLAALKKSPTFYSAALPLRIVPPLFNAYAGGEHYGLHVDGSIRSV